MCTNPSSPPDYSNVCNSGSQSDGSSVAASTHQIPNLCGTGSECGNISPEWVFYGVNASTCCTGLNVVCQRKDFAGDPLQCCILNYTNTKNLSNCFTDAARQNTCDPKYRNLHLPNCRAVFSNVCIANNSTDANFVQAWQNGNCATFITESLTTPESVTWAQSAMAEVFQKYFSSGSSSSSGGGSQEGIAPPGQSGSFQTYLYNFCSANPTACQVGLNNTCAQYQRTDATGNINIVNFCGCHMSSSVYALYQNKFGIDRACDPLCARMGVIPNTDSAGNVSKCAGNVCIIDDVTVTLDQSTAGNFNFSQSCGGCEGNVNCNCTISGVDINAIEAKLGNISLNQVCQGKLNCFQVDPNNPNSPGVQVPCDSSNTGGGSNNTGGGNSTPGVDPNTANTNAFVALTIILIIFLFIVLLMYFARKYGT